MKKSISGGQSRSLIASFTVDIPWEKIEADVQPFIMLPPEQKGRMFAAFIANNFRLTVGDPKIIKAKPFDPVKFLGEGWTIWKGPADGDGLLGEEDICPKSLAFTVVELSEFVFKTCLKEGESSITYEEKIRRLKEMLDFIGFGLNVFLGLWEDYLINRENSALEWLHQNFGVTLMDFPGVVLRNPRGDREVLCLHRYDNGWLWSLFCLGSQCNVDRPSAGCADLLDL